MYKMAESIRTWLDEFPIKYDNKVEELNEAYRKNDLTHNLLEYVLKNAHRCSKYFRSDEVNENSEYGVVVMKLGFRKKILISFPWKNLGSVKVYLNKKIRESKVDKILEKVIYKMDNANFSWYESSCLSR
tara:strand:- start:1489 stop:1878 length:390 start_codon:yes stop_codon:yes gene_type:complete